MAPAVRMRRRHQPPAPMITATIILGMLIALIGTEEASPGPDQE